MSFNLSLAKDEVKDDPNQVKASTELQTRIDPMTQKPYKVDVTEGGITIDKSKAPAIMLDGPLGHQYTEILNRVLSKENMGAIVAALSAEEEDAKGPTSGTPTGYVDVGMDGTTQNGEHGTAQGYLYVADGEHLPSTELTRVMSRLIEKKNEDPNANLGVVLASEGRLCSTAESLVRHATSLGVKVAIRPSAVSQMVVDMARRTKGK